MLAVCVIAVCVFVQCLLFVCLCCASYLCFSVLAAFSDCCLCVCSVLGHRPEEVDRRACDMYSFAIILWEIATGKIPFLGLSPMQVGIKVSKRN